jgi:hypothetical protein
VTLTRGFGIVFGSGFAFAAGGGVLGYSLALVAPSYYRSVFSGGDAAGFDPVQVGIGLGISQGAIAGLAVGSIVVLAVAISGARRPAKAFLDRD